MRSWFAQVIDCVESVVRHSGPFVVRTVLTQISNIVDGFLFLLYVFIHMYAISLTSNTFICHSYHHILINVEGRGRTLWDD